MVIVLLLAGLMLAVPVPAEAYVGPGAGFALLSSFFVLFTTMVLALVAVISWPVRALLRMARHRRPAHAALARRVIILGFDGQDPQMTDALLSAGKLPNFAKLAARGCYHRLRTTFPSVSPVAW